METLGICVIIKPRYINRSPSFHTSNVESLDVSLCEELQGDRAAVFFFIIKKTFRR